DLNNLINPLNAVTAGYTFFASLTFDTHGTQPKRISESELIALLSDREMLVLQNLAIGYSNKAIAEKLLLSNSTVSLYKTILL
ncbi:LuxR C-terminal-related transcriptional regulator, partial [Pseudomonas aeruginosa]